MGSKNSLLLKTGWDVSLSPPNSLGNERGYFFGRDSQKEMLTNEILWKKNGSILVSGHRGVGKTALIYKTLHEVKERDKNCITVLLNAAQLEAESEIKESIDPNLIIKNLIRRLYSTVQTEKIKLDSSVFEKIDTLYLKAIASEYKDTSQNSRLVESTQERVTNTEAKASANEKLLQTLYVGFFVVLSLLVNRIGEYIALPLGLNDLVPFFSVLISAQSPITFNFFYQRVSTNRSMQKTETSAKKLYEFDNSLGNLEFDLEAIHRAIDHDNKKLIYVIDELDKLLPSKVFEIIRFFKNLFTLSEAIFIFVGGEEIYDFKAKEAGSAYRAPEHTYFTSRYFLTRPTWKDIDSYLSEVIEGGQHQGGEIEKLKRAISFDAENDFFNIKTFIRDRITGFTSTGKGVLSQSEIERDTQKSFLHTAISLFENKYFVPAHSSWQENEKVIRILFKQAKQIMNGFRGTTIDDPGGDMISDEVIREFNKLLWKLEVFDDNIQSLGTIDIKGLKVERKKYVISGTIGKQPPENLDEPVEFEKRFIEAFNQYSEYLLQIVNIERNLNNEKPLSLADILSSSSSLLASLEVAGIATNDLTRDRGLNNDLQNNRLTLTRQGVDERTKTTLQNLNKLKKNILIHLASIAQNQVTESGNRVTASELKNSESLFVGPAQKIRDTYLKRVNRVVSYNSKQVLFVEEEANLIRELQLTIEESATSHQVVVLSNKPQNLGFNGVHQIIIREKEFEDSAIQVLKKVIGFLSKDNGNLDPFKK